MSINKKTSIALSSIFVLSGLVFFEAPLAMACSSSSPASSGYSHGSSIGSGSVTVCVGSSSQTAATTSTQTITRVVTTPVINPAPKPAPVYVPAPIPVKKVVASTPKPVVICPTAAQKLSMPKSPDAAERWVQNLCGITPKVQAAPKPTPAPVAKPAPKPTPKPEPITITETIVIEVPRTISASAEAVVFYPNPLLISFYPNSVLTIGQQAQFSANPSLHYRSQVVLGRQAEVEFTPRSVSWEFSDGQKASGTNPKKSFASSGKYQVVAQLSYLVRYRLLGETSWQRVSGEIVARSNQLEIAVGAQIIKGSLSTGLLVGGDCGARPRSFGCQV
jgi:hypothetical protein